MKGGIHMQEITLETIFNTLLQFKEETNNRFNQIDKRFEEVDKHFNQIDKRFEEIDKHFDEIDKHFDEIDKRFEEIDNHFEEIDKRFEEIDNHFEEIDNHFNKSDSRLDSLERIVTRIEFEHGEKLAFLCDNAKINNEKHEEFEKELKSIQTQLMDHELRIQILEENFQKAL